MKKIFVGVLCVGLLLGFYGMAAADWFTEEYAAGAAGPQVVAEGESYNFGFDFWLLNDGTWFEPTNSVLEQVQDAEGADAFDQWYYAAITVTLSSTDWSPEIAGFELVVWNDVQEETPILQTVQLFNSTPVSPFYRFTYLLPDYQVDQFAANGWGKLTITAIDNNLSYFNNDFSIEQVIMDVSTSPVPEPSTLLLLGAGLLGLAAYGRKKMKK